MPAEMEHNLEEDKATEKNEGPGGTERMEAEHYSTREGNRILVDDMLSKLISELD